MDHRAFPKIPTVLPDTGGGSEWVATEKLHGAQLVVATDGARVWFGKRKAWLSDDEPFFGWQLLRADLTAAALAVYEALARRGALYIYGELFGGHYPHADVEPVPALSPVQTGIWYAPELRFAAFDMLLVEGETELFLAHSQLVRLASAAELGSVPVLGHGPRRALASLPVRYSTRVPELLGLPPLPDNVAEGFVLKPDVELAPDARVLVKHKIPEFDENRFDESVAFDNQVHLSLAELVHWAKLMFNPVRIASARSKVGEDPQAIREEALLDVWIDLEAIFPRRMLALDEAEQQGLRDALAGLAASVSGP
jgi:Rnl2 family RNA ligase